MLLSRVTAAEDTQPGTAAEVWPYPAATPAWRRRSTPRPPDLYMRVRDAIGFPKHQRTPGLADLVRGLSACRGYWHGARIPKLAAAFVALGILCLVLLTRNRSEGTCQASVAYLALFGLSTGRSISIALRGADHFTASDEFCVSGGYSTRAVHVAVLGMAAFTIAAELGGGNQTVKLRIRPSEAAERPALAVIGLVVHLIGLVVFAVAVMRASGTDSVCSAAVVWPTSR